MKVFAHCLLFCALIVLTACTTPEEQSTQKAHAHMNAAIALEPPGDYFIGRRVYKKDYKFWGYIREPGKPWTTAKLVMLNEKTKFAPDREINKIGSDNNYEYKLYGRFSGETVYEPASNGFYPEFVLTGYDAPVINPAPIFHTAAAIDPDRRVIGVPY